MTAEYGLGFTPPLSELNVRLPVTGRIPEWLAGTLIRNGPAGLPTERFPSSHWFDGLAMLHAFTIRGGRVDYRNQRLASAARDADERGERRLGFAIDPCQSLFGRIRSVLFPRAIDNANVNVAKVMGRFVALTETPPPIEFDGETLRTIGGLERFRPPRGQLTTAHPHFDPVRGQMINYTTQISWRSRYRIYTVDGNQGQSRQVATIPVSRPSYMHSFAVTENHIVLMEFPLRLNPWDLLLGGQSFMNALHWDSQAGTALYIVERDGRFIRRLETDAMFAFHHVNAFEDRGELVLDLAAYRDASIVSQLNAESLFESRVPFPSPELRRLRVNVAGNRIRHEVLGSEVIELPTICGAALDGRPYRYAFGVSRAQETPDDFLNQIVKFDTRRETTRNWRQASSYPGEAVFVRRPGATHEDDGVLLSVVLDAAAGTSFLLILDAHSLQELARAVVPQHVPFGFHGQFFEASSQ